MTIVKTSVIVDASSLINLAVSGHLPDLLRLASVRCCLCDAVRRESLYVRTAEGGIEPIDCEALVNSNALYAVDLSDEEQDLFISYAAQIDDGEAMCLAIAQSRGFALLSDDAKARKLAAENGVAIFGTAALLKAWSGSVEAREVSATIQRIETLAKFNPHPSDPDLPWWNAQRGK